MTKLILLLFIAANHLLFSQLITWTPPFPTENDSITVIFDATKGNAGLKGYTGDVYAHTGVITSFSTSPSDWRYVLTSWGQNTPKTKLERIGTDIYQYKIYPTVRSFYNVSFSEKILQAAFVFRSGVQVGGRYLEGKTESGGDIFLPISEEGLNVSIVEPAQSFLFADLNDTIKVKAVSSHAVNISLYIQNNLAAQTADSVLYHDIIASETGKKWVKAIASASDGSTAADSFYYVVNPALTIQELPAQIEPGINYISNTSVTLCLFAPQKKFVYVIGDFNNWEVETDYLMKLTPDSNTYWLEVDGLVPNQEYIFQYFVDGEIKIADPYSEKVSDPWNDQNISSSTYPNLIKYPAGKTSEIASVIEMGQEPYPWKITDFKRPEKTRLIIYELLLRDFLSTHDYKTLIDTLNYLKELGINAIELMPIMEFEGNESWGYNPSFHLAVDKYYGPRNELKRFIDTAHEMGFTVILDMVLNHAFGQSPLVRLYWDAANNRPAVNSPWFNQTPRHPYNVGFDFNHESAATKYFVDRVNKFWLTEYKFDGFRFDLSKGFTQKYSGDVDQWGVYDDSRIALLKRMADKIWEVDSSAYVILEHFADNSEEKVLSDYGMLLWGNLNYNYNEAAMGYHDNNKSNFSWGSYKVRGWNDPHLITYMESHDEERLMYKNLTYGNSSGDYSIKNLAIALNRIKLAAAFFFTIPGPKMIWQFGELGYDISIDNPCRLCNKPIRWDYFDDPRRNKLYKTFKTLIELKKNYEAFESYNFVLNVAGSVKRINLYHSTMDVVVVGNFDVITKSINPAFSKTGVWYNYFLDDNITVTNTSEQISVEPGEFHVFTNVKLPAPEPDLLTNIEKISDVRPGSFLLEQNFPNPFNPSTTISYHLPEKEFVTLKVYDLLGREVGVLVQKELDAGIYTIEWNPGQSASGVYIYTLQAGKNISSKKMILLR